MNTNDFFENDNLADQVFYLGLSLRVDLSDVVAIIDFIRKNTSAKIIYRRTSPLYLYIVDRPPSKEAPKQ